MHIQQLLWVYNKALPDELKGKGGIYDTAGYDDPMSAGASITPETDEILRANAMDFRE